MPLTVGRGPTPVPTPAATCVARVCLCPHGRSPLLGGTLASCSVLCRCRRLKTRLIFTKSGGKRSRVPGEALLALPLRWVLSPDAAPAPALSMTPRCSSARRADPQSVDNKQKQCPTADPVGGSGQGDWMLVFESGWRDLDES